MNDERLDELERLAAAASPGPWVASHRCHGCTADDDERFGLGLEVSGPEPATDRGQFARGADARLIAAARTAIPELVAEIRRLREGT